MPQSSPVQQMMAGNPAWYWNINSVMRPTAQPTSPFLSTPSNLPANTSTTSLHFNNTPSWNDNQDQLPASWSQRQIGAKGDMGKFQAEEFENWESQMFNREVNANIVDVKGNSVGRYESKHGIEEIHAVNSWSQTMSISSPNSSVTSFSNNMLEFASNGTDGKFTPSDPFSECNSTASGGTLKKARVQPSTSTTPATAFKVRKEKLGDRVTALHQLVSPFGKTDTASVLLEAIGYIRFLQSQIEALSLPYLGSGSRNTKQQQSVLLNGNCKKRKEVREQDTQEESQKDLRSRGLCLVPLSCTVQVGSNDGEEYFWAPAFHRGFHQ